MVRVDRTCCCALVCHGCSVCLIEHGYEQSNCVTDIFIIVAGCCASMAKCCSLLNFSPIAPNYTEVIDVDIKPITIPTNLIKNEL